MSESVKRDVMTKTSVGGHRKGVSKGLAPASCQRKPPHGPKGSTLFRSRSRSSQQSLAEQKSSFPVRYLEPGKTSDMSRMSHVRPFLLFGHLFRNKAVFFVGLCLTPCSTSDSDSDDDRLSGIGPGSSKDLPLFLRPSILEYLKSVH